MDSAPNENSRQKRASFQTNPRLGGYQTIFLSLYADTLTSAALTYRERLTFFLTACLSRCSFNSGSSSTVNIVRFMITNVILNAVLQNFLQKLKNIFIWVLQLSYIFIPLHS